MGTSRNWSRENLAWAAGIFEGEGSITRRRKRDTNLVLAMTDEDVVRRFHEAIGHGTVYGPYKTSSGVKLQWRWACTGSKNCIAVLAALWCFLGKRRKERATIAMKEMALIRSHGSNFCKRGHPFDELNTITENGGRVCRRCKYDGINRRAKQKRLRLKEEKYGHQHSSGTQNGSSEPPPSL